MPIHRYTPVTPPCRLCGNGFEHRQNPSEPDLNACPTCGQAVQRAAVETINTPKLLKPLSVSDAKSLGFSVFKKTAAGEYERQ
jgi:putative FmdB family regulatory protein